ncbi:biotin/lipoyl-binding protein [Alkalicaulis satelles]|uniref:Biotin/lipoyl-binding protein n=1 Tax=Alkalicaulis satelles TaxID=2609175 RepID=A0A5M6ZGF1_9PROT|nr:biotin carboxylase N-terminal domain-containing protein [Alkalicaulis satelles]KAA5803335.1 biotin/lipoyl-binding protein [Alkalicaulis satelles]
MTARRRIRSVLVANRGEIAVRVLRHAKNNQMRAIAVYSDADADAMHVREADMAVRIGPAPAAQSYLDMDAILAAARATGADAIHPGYGFLSENAGFARAVIEAGLIWIGPPPDAIEAMGDKARAKALLAQSGVPMIPGWQGEDQSDANLARQAETIGYPLLIKAVAGGGGRGMRAVHDPAEFADALASARREAKSAFGDDTVMLEKLIERARHVEVQVFADMHGNVLHIGERDCSAQRRRQKVVEEAPSPAVSPVLRAAMGEVAVRVAQAVNYAGAGTVEFLLDDSGAFYFLEMNTRLQVEHPVTEEVYGMDLVGWQFLAAEGGALPATQDQMEPHGHAIEVRLYAEDPLDGFKPQSGEIAWFDPMAADRQVRIDTGFETGDVISTAYDAMAAKIIAYAPNRDEAIDLLLAGLAKAPMMGVKTNRDFLMRLIDSQAFRSGALTIDDLDAWAGAGEGPFAAQPVPHEAAAIAALVMAAHGSGVVRSGSVTRFALPLEADGETLEPFVEQTGPDALKVTLDGQSHRIALVDWRGVHLDYRLDGVDRRCLALRGEDGVLHIALSDRIVSLREPALLGRADAADPSTVRAPVSGAVAAVHVKPGDEVKAGDVLVVMEAMKMEMRLTAAADAVVAAVHAAPGQQAAGGALLIELKL